MPSLRAHGPPRAAIYRPASDSGGHGAALGSRQGYCCGSPGRTCEAGGERPFEHRTEHAFVNRAERRGPARRPRRAAPEMEKAARRMVADGPGHPNMAYLSIESPLNGRARRAPETEVMSSGVTVCPAPACGGGKGGGRGVITPLFRYVLRPLPLRHKSEVETANVDRYGTGIEDHSLARLLLEY
ncbi:unnamed protein product [Lampetra planeri]